MILIGLAGPARSGKDTAGHYLVHRYGFTAHAFAAPIKRAVAKILDLSITELEARKDDIVPWLGETPRALMQVIGTECGRALNPDLWLRFAEHQLDQIPHGGRLCLTDVRFDNEAEWVRSHGGVIWHLERFDKPYVRHHASEAGVARQTGDALLQNNSTLAVLYRQIESALALLQQADDRPRLEQFQ